MKRMTVRTTEGRISLHVLVSDLIRTDTPGSSHDKSLFPKRTTGVSALNNSSKLHRVEMGHTELLMSDYFCKFS